MTEAPSQEEEKGGPPADQCAVSMRKMEQTLKANRGFFERVVEHRTREDLEAASTFENVQKLDFLYSSNTTISFKDVAFSVKGKDPRTKKMVNRVILEPISGVVAPGELVALMGPSGCGKSTLLDILAKKKTSPFTGGVYLNGRPAAVDKLYDLITAYVPQEDVMPEEWLVHEAITFNFMLRRLLPATVNMTAIEPLIEYFIDSLGLSSVKNTCIGGPNLRGVSGGQRRRVTLARGLATGANVFFCDEPTSGLSSTDAENVIRRLKILSLRLGKSFVVVIHQPKPEVAAIFDKLILLTSQPGRAVYNGPMKDCFLYYAAVGFPVPAFSNPADHYLDMVSPGQIGEQSALFVEYYNRESAGVISDLVDHELAHAGMPSSEVLEEVFTSLESIFGKLTVSKRTLQSRKFKYMAPFERQLALVLHRTVVLKSRSKGALVAQLVSTIVKGVILGIAFLQIDQEAPIYQVAFIFLLAQMEVMGLLQGVESTIKGRTIMKYEVSDRLYRDEAFIISMAIVDTVTFLFFNIIYSTIAFALSGLSWSYFGTFYGWSLFCLLVFQSYFQMVAAASTSSADATTKALPGMIMFVLFNGYFVTKATVASWMMWAIYLSPLFYFIQQVSMELFSDGTKKNEPNYLDSGQYVIDFYDFKDMLGLAVVVLVLELLICRVLQVVFLKKMNNPSR